MKFKPMTEESEWEWVKSRAKLIACEDSQGIVAYDDRGIQAIAAFDSFTVDACNVHLAIDNPIVIRSGFLSEIARHLFIQCGRKRIFGLVPSTNKKAMKLNLHLGWKQVARIPDALAEGIDYMVLCMKREECRWLPKELKEAA